MFFSNKKLRMPSPDEALRGRTMQMPVGDSHFVNGHRIKPPFADTMPQALILTSIVISFGVTAFALALAFRSYRSVGTDDLDQMQTTDA